MSASVEPHAGPERHAAQKLFRPHRPPPGPLKCQNAASALATGNREVISEQGAGLAATLPCGGAQDLDPNRLAFDRKLEPRTRNRRQPADMIMYPPPRHLPLDTRLGAINLVRIGDARFELRLPRQPAAFEVTQRLSPETGAELADPATPP